MEKVNLERSFKWVFHQINSVSWAIPETIRYKLELIFDVTKCCNAIRTRNSYFNAGIIIIYAAKKNIAILPRINSIVNMHFYWMFVVHWGAHKQFVIIIFKSGSPYYDN